MRVKAQSYKVYIVFNAEMLKRSSINMTYRIDPDIFF